MKANAHISNTDDFTNVAFFLDVAEYMVRHFTPTKRLATMMATPGVITALPAEKLINPAPSSDEALKCLAAINSMSFATIKTRQVALEPVTVGEMLQEVSLKVEEAARIIRVAPKTLEDMCRDGRYPESSYKRYAENGTYHFPTAQVVAFAENRDARTSKLGGSISPYAEHGEIVMNVALEIPDEKPDENKSAPRIVMMSPKELDPSPFDLDVNPPATPEEELSLYESVAKDGVQVPLTAGRVGGKGKHMVVKGSRRHAVALALGLSEIPVELKEYESDEAMRQDALRDNLERRQLSDPSRAALANTLWRSFSAAEDKKEMAAQGYSPRKRAAIAGGISEGKLASYRYVLDSGNVVLINKMKSGEFRISKAANEAKKLTEGKIGAAKTASNSSFTDQMKVLRETFDDLSRATGILRDTVKRGKAVMKLVKKGQVKEPAALIKQMLAVNQSIATLASASELAEQRNSTSRDGESAIRTTAASATDMDLPLIDPKEGEDA